jgi:hypothetical protein
LLDLMFRCQPEGSLPPVELPGCISFPADVCYGRQPSACSRQRALRPEVNQCLTLTRCATQPNVRLPSLGTS